MYSNSLCPVINKPSRITTKMPTLIDDIFTNRLEEKLVGGLLVSNITDHLPIFAVFHNIFKIINKTRITQYKLIRKSRAEIIEAFKKD